MLQDRILNAPHDCLEMFLLIISPAVHENTRVTLKPRVVRRNRKQIMSNTVSRIARLPTSKCVKRERFFPTRRIDIIFTLAVVRRRLLLIVFGAKTRRRYIFVSRTLERNTGDRRDQMLRRRGLAGFGFHVIAERIIIPRHPPHEICAAARSKHPVRRIENPDVDL